MVEEEPPGGPCLCRKRGPSRGQPRAVPRPRDAPDRALGLMLPLAALPGAVVTPWALLLLLAYPAQMLRLRARGEPWARAVFLVLGRFAEARGVLDYRAARALGKKRGLIEYK